MRLVISGVGVGKRFRGWWNKKSPEGLFLFADDALGVLVEVVGGFRFRRGLVDDAVVIDNVDHVNELSSFWRLRFWVRERISLQSTANGRVLTLRLFTSRLTPFSTICFSG